jgi:signal transduction histidine kinase
MAGRPRSLFWSLTASIVGVLLLTAILQVLFAVAVVEPIVRGRISSQADELVETVAPEIERVILEGNPQALPRLLGRYQRLAEGLVLVYEPVEGPPVHPGAWMRRGRGPGRGDRRPPMEDLPVVVRHDVEVEGRIAGQLVVLRARPGLAFSHWLPLRWVLLFPVSLIAAALGGMWIFRRLQRRIGKLQDHARAVGEGDLHVRIDDPGDDELGLLGHQLNEMTGNLATARERVDAMEAERKRLLADITHELSTPLTSVRGYAETLLDDVVEVDAQRRTRFLEEILHASERMGILIDDLVDLTRLEGGAGRIEPERLDLRALVENSLERHRAGFNEVALRFLGPEHPVFVVADGRRLEQVVDNLLANALRHVPSGGHVEVEVGTGDDQAVLEVRDDGPGFPEEALPHVFERFYRAEASRTAPGSGLGLAIVSEIVLRHGGTVEATNRAPGGASLRVRLPLAG